MAGIGNGYGSECHLLRYMGRHRHELDRLVLKAIGGDSIDWLDFGFDNRPKDERSAWPDVELKELRFLPPGHPVRVEWERTWPRSGNVINWDAVGLVRVGELFEWVLVEAKAHLQELHSDCSAKKAGGLDDIVEVLDQTKRDLGVPADRDWLKGYYQYCNRVAILHFLGARSVPSRLVFVYFCGDRGGSGRDCPEDEAGWSKALEAQDKHVGLPKGHGLSARLHKLFLPVAGRAPKEDG